MKNTSLKDYVNSSPLVQAAITEAVHRFYYDRVLSDKDQDKKDLQETNASGILSMLWNLQPNWRMIIEKAGKRYNASDVKAVALNRTPDPIPPFTVELQFSQKEIYIEKIKQKPGLFRRILNLFK